ncbi:unnamed protein product, partial [Bemisia tabaci]
MSEQFPTAFATVFILHFAVTSVALAPNSVTLWKNRDFGGQQCTIEVQGCQPVCPGMEAQTSSLKGTTSCVNFYRRPNCTAYMSTWHSTDGDVSNWKHTPFQDSIVSVGDCKQPVFPANTMTFYEHKRFGGRFCNIPVSGCRPMCSELENRASSAEGTASCVKLFNEPNCQGYMGMLNLWKNANDNFADYTYQDSISSIADCDNNSVTFYQDWKFHGKRCTLPVRGCTQMCPELDNQASSVDGNFLCLKVYSEPNCGGYLGYVTPTDEIHKDFYRTYLQDTISSFSDCNTNNSVTFFERREFSGKRCDIPLKGCQRMCPELDNQASSVQADAECIRVYDDANCTSSIRVLLFYKHPYTRYFDFDTTDMQDKISSVSDC